MESYIQISKINDFIFCPYSIYLHSIYDSFNTSTYHSVPQTRGKIKHENIDQAEYSSSTNILQGISIYSTKYKLVGKIDIYDKKNKCLIERKYKVKEIYDGYKYQLYAQYFCLLEKKYKIEKLLVHSLADNKRYKIPIPEGEELEKFENTIKQIHKFGAENKDMLNANTSPAKCRNCIYNTLCAYSNA